jgi:hypothetical protein
MSKELVFKLVVSESGKEAYSVNLSYEVVSSIVSDFPDNESSNDFFRLAAQHAASVVRENVAYKDHLNSDVLEILSKDSSISVLRNLVRSQAFRENVTQEELVALIKLDTEIAQTIANNVDSYEQADVNELASLLSKHEDPSVVYSLAQNWGTPKEILKTLLTHPDPYIANEAKTRLED